ncbi:MAG TPA: CdaR family protein [Candidatus Binataceae bacterium]|jgi:YbbR domain-containing protein|nr:CdaR family protein [Candidatus Binataceae bacterium]
MELRTIAARIRSALTRIVVGADVPRQISPPLRILLMQRIRRNLGLRAIAVVLAIGLWFFVNAGQRGALAPMRVPISYRALPIGLAIVNQRPDFVQIEVRGPRTLLSLLDPDRMVLRLDLSGVTVGQAVFKIGPEMFNVPRQTDVTRISPSQIVLDIDRIVDRQVPIRVSIQGQPAAGYRVTLTKANPAVATVRGPSRFVFHTDRVRTSPVDVSGARADINQPVSLPPPGDRVTVLGPQTVEAAVSIGEIIADREFRGLPIEVRDTDYKVKVEPQRIAITVRGPLNQLAGLDLRGSVFVSAEDMEPGAHNLTVQIELPDGIQLVRAVPGNVRVRLYRQKRAGSG